MYGVKQTGPCEGDRVQVETLGTVVDFEERAGVRGAVVELAATTTRCGFRGGS